MAEQLQAMTVAEFAKRIRRSRRTAYDLVAARAIDVVDLGTGKRPSYGITEEALAKFLKSREIKARGSAA
jgi:hypothetical protein